MGRADPENPQPDAFINHNYFSMTSIPQDPASLIPLVNRMSRVTLRPHTLTSPDVLSMHLIPEGQATHNIRRKKRTSFTHQQRGELEAIFSRTMFPDKNLQKKLALKLNLEETTVKVWFRNRRFKLKKQQKQQKRPVKQLNKILPAQKDVATSLRTSANPRFSPVPSDCSSSLSSEPAGSSDWSEDLSSTESSIADFQMHNPQLERLVASVPALVSGDYDIAQIIELYSFPDEGEISSCSFSCLYQYLSSTGSQLEGQDSCLSNFAGPAVGLSPEKTCTANMASQGFAPYSMGKTWHSKPSSRVALHFSGGSTKKYQTT